MHDNPFQDPSVVSSGPQKEEEPLPSWLEDVPVETPLAPGDGYVPPGAPGFPPPPAPAPEAPKDNLVIYMRLVNVGVTILMSAMACIKLLSFPGFNSAVIAIYIWFFALLLCCFETHLKQVSKIIAENFGFLYHVKGRCAFLVLSAMLCFGISTLGIVAGVALLLAAGFNAYVIYEHPEYEMQQQAADIEQRGPATITDAYFTNDAFLGAGVAWASQNPQAAASAVSAGATFASENPHIATSAAAYSHA
ncbi:hypothetical protein CTAYLR_007626 [Chrysophaeum taylorii]|uniref:Uncharacterized protein n=1 Tax=Chrysophaeum taylorii TaxID=2483200 RepID=A0AAD7XMN1_9STRA|nr:hypothetical protein CTAYLR_007626 [Chrysophaeum taylorii]